MAPPWLSVTTPSMEPRKSCAEAAGPTTREANATTAADAQVETRNRITTSWLRTPEHPDSAASTAVTRLARVRRNRLWKLNWSIQCPERDATGQIYGRF